MSQKKILIGVAVGSRYERQADVMAESFLNHNDGWNVKIYKGDEINRIVPAQFHQETPHYITDKARRLTSHRVIFDGVPNLGLFEVNGEEGIDICSVVIDVVSSNPSAFYNRSLKNAIWTQTVASYLPHIGYDVVYDCDPSHNVAWWSLEYGDRKIEKDMNDSRFHVRCEGKTYDLRSFHFSSVNQLDRYGDEVRELKEEYLRKAR